MGKKKIAQKSEVVATEEAAKIPKKTEASAKARIEKGKIYVQASYNNTMITVTDDKGNVVTWLSAGSLGLSGPKKSTPFAAAKVAEAISEKIQKTGPFNVEILVRGVGGGRDSAVRTFAAKGFNISSIKDVTPIPHNGPRPPKVRRV
ncbi:MAG: Ribosomal protein S11, bacterial-type [Candidatus Jorgensenbacteria bacterium GW2011_GWA1_48_11]|uniref:Small ribosomal subunit protein uS11 n=1 Tax=Candidatus Jorgensenbacteria bacterium GW2011_GWA1_48_11 TaxID=1618660 RepID=A0A0G1XA12_9BACT|nr:MAG: Ribosomal protein S11, bacterial-type [Candidatus Jorgensenbacteria bacterium GW2011_GWA1_48_11]KKW11851.1 MAG: Ribosomal protein S11, bacterial-type [Candidatus Jorgensenbacteria bacterium GW2011_GWB1_49_9]